MRNILDIKNDIKNEIAKCKGMTPDSIATNLPLIEEIGLHGDDFMAVAAHIHRKYGARPGKDAYGANLTIDEWARIIAECNYGDTA